MEDKVCNLLVFLGASLFKTISFETKENILR